MRLLLTTLGYDVAVANSYRQARQILDERDFHVLMCDPDLSDGDGLELLRYASRSFPTCGLVLTGTEGAEAESRSLAAGFSAHLVKPVSVAQLEDAINTALSRWTRAVRSTWQKASQRPPPSTSSPPSP
jgi:two-component system CheB/CheR fusion protein